MGNQQQETKSFSLLQVFSGNCIQIFQGHTSGVVDAALTADSSILVTASHDGTARSASLELEAVCLLTD